MAKHTPGLSANTAVRYFLRKVGEHHLGRVFDTDSGSGLEDWNRIKNEVFDSECAYCGKKEGKLQIEHLVMINTEQCGLDHPGNVVPCCGKCNVRMKTKEGAYVDWKTQLRSIDQQSSDGIDYCEKRLNRILNHIHEEQYPNFTSDELAELKAIAKSLYEAVRGEPRKAFDRYLLHIS
jgi:hypothetical protein